MGKASRNYIGKPYENGTWRIWNKKASKWWGEIYKRRPDEMIDELNGKITPNTITELSKELQKENKFKVETICDKQ